MEYLPISGTWFGVLWFLSACLVALFQIGVLQFAFEDIGVARRYWFLLLAGALLGSYINIPVAHLPPEQVMSGRIVDFFGVRYIAPVVLTWPGTVVAVNVGGAIIPVLVSGYLLVKHGQFAKALLAVGLVTWVVHRVAQPVPGVGISVPVFIPPLITALVAVSISRRHAAPLAYIAGTLGTLIGADLLNLGHIQGLGAPVASIGGAGKFDGIFLTGLVAALLAGLFTRVAEPKPVASELDTRHLVHTAL